MNKQYRTPELEELYVGMVLEKVDEDVGRAELMKKVEIGTMFNKEYIPEDCFRPHILTEVNLKMYTLNPHSIKNELRIEI